MLEDNVARAQKNPTLLTGGRHFSISTHAPLYHPDAKSRENIVTFLRAETSRENIDQTTEVGEVDEAITH